ncbi:MAG: hypothetical protein IID46_03335 [Planctomycetes bacterium]|nr:hypothetical protein [Planctomycetota bacterium]
MTSTLGADFFLDSAVECQDGEFVGVNNRFFEDQEFETMGFDPQTSTSAKPGSDDKVIMLAARYASGLPLWHKKDCYDHAPSSSPLE